MSDQRSRATRDTSLYDATIAFYAIIVGVAVVRVLQDVADDVLSSPLAGNWSFRFMALGLVVMAANWLHRLAAEMNLARFADEPAPSSASGEAGELPGLRGPGAFHAYRRVIIAVWFGAGVVILLVVVAAAVDRGLTTFLAVFAVYVLWRATWDFAFLAHHREQWSQAWKTIRPDRLLRQLQDDRRMPASQADFDELVKSNPSVERMWATADLYWLLGGLIFLLWTVGLWAIVGAYSQAEDLAALAWLLSVSVSLIADYYFFPYFYTA